jgi:tRNA pseudouridine38-40 synthase
MRLALILEYDGAEFSGSQFQRNARTVQGVSEQALATIFGDDVTRLSLASRTDAGVHAIGQVASFDVETRMAADELRRAMNGNLPRDISVRHIQRVDGGFDPRRHAIAREYRYVINDCETSSPLRRRYEYQVGRHLDVNAMMLAAQRFIGTHDFESFAASTTDERSTVRHVVSASVVRNHDDRVLFDIRANAFVRQQIRRMAAALIAVGGGSRTEEWIVSLIASPERNAATQNAPPHGLTLRRVIYPPGTMSDVGSNDGTSS